MYMRSIQQDLLFHIFFMMEVKKTIADASRSLKPDEYNYGQMEKEALAIMFAIRKFH